MIRKILEFINIIKLLIRLTIFNTGYTWEDLKQLIYDTILIFFVSAFIWYQTRDISDLYLRARGTFDLIFFFYYITLLDIRWPWDDDDDDDDDENYYYKK